MGFPNGAWHPTGLSDTAPPEEIAASAMRRNTTNLTVVEVRKIVIPRGGGLRDRAYTAILAESGDDQKIVLVDGAPSSGRDVVARVYDVP